MSWAKRSGPPHIKASTIVPPPVRQSRGGPSVLQRITVATTPATVITAETVITQRRGACPLDPVPCSSGLMKSIRKHCGGRHSQWMLNGGYSSVTSKKA